MDELIGDEDGFMISLSPAHTISWSTQFGGDDQFGTPERIIQLALDSDAQLYAIGATDALYDPNNDLFFPLTDRRTGLGSTTVSQLMQTASSPDSVWKEP